LNAIDFVFANASSFSLPLLVMYGGDDKITYPSGGQDFVKMVQGDVTLNCGMECITKSIMNRARSRY